MTVTRWIDIGIGLLLGVMVTFGYAFWNGSRRADTPAAPVPAKCGENYVEMRGPWGEHVCIHGYPLNAK